MGDVSSEADSLWRRGRRYFSAPTFVHDADLTRTARILSSLLNYLTVVLLLASTVGLPFLYQNKLGSAVTVTTIWAIILTVRTLMRRGRVRLASALLVITLWLIFSTLTILTGALHSINNVYFVFLTVIAGLLLGGRAAIAVAVASSLVCLWLAIIDHLGFQTLQPFPAPAFSRWGQVTLALLLTIAPLNLALQSLSRALRSTQFQLEQRRHSERALRREKDFSGALIAGLPGIFTVFDAEGRLLRWNTAHREITGYDPEQLSNLSAADLFGRSTWEALQKQLAQPTESGAFELETELHCAGGETVLFYLSGWRRQLDEGAFLILVGIDISERKRAEQERQHLEQMLLQAQKMESIGRLAGGIAHDFNNLLTGIGGHAELALRRAPTAELHDDLQEILRATQSASELTGQLLTFSRRQIAQPCVIDLHEQIKRLSRMLTRLLGETVSLRSELRAEHVTILIDPHQLEQVLINLAINARDAMGEGGTLTLRTAIVEQRQPCQVGLTDLPAGRYVELEVQDTGAGIPAPELEKIFEPFYTTKGETEGTGLGLSTVFGIVTQNGGGVEARSSVGSGSVFRLLFPHADREADVLPSPTAGPETSSKVNPKDHTVLLVEDDPRVRHLTERVLRELRYGVVVCTGAAQALREAQRHAGAIDVLLTDVVMPDMNGRELAEAISERFPDIRVLFVSGYTEDVLGKHGVVEQGINFIRKPYSIKALAERLERLLTASGSGLD